MVEEEHIPLVTDLSEDLCDEDGYSLDFAGEMIPQLFHGTAKIGDTSVRVIKATNPRDCISKMVTVQYPDGRIADELIENLLFPNRLIKGVKDEVQSSTKEEYVQRTVQGTDEG